MAAALLTGFNAVADKRVSLSWDPSPDPDVVDYIVQIGLRSRMYSRTIRSAGRTSATINGLKDGVGYFFSVKAVNRSGFESDPSEEIQVADACAGRVIDLAVTPVQTPAGGLKLVLPVLPNRKYQVQATEDLQNWTPLWTSPVTASQSLLEFLDPDRRLFSRRFYRVQMAGPFVESPNALGVTAVTQPVAGNKLGFYTMMGRAYEVQSSNDGRSWRTIWSSPLSAPGGFVEFIDPATAAPGSRRYRLIAVADPVAAQGQACGGDGSLAPAISDPPDQRTYMNVPTAAVPVTVLDPDTPAANLRLASSSSNPALVKDANIAISSAGASRFLTITPARDQWGHAVIDLVVSDGVNAAATAFNLEVLPYTPDTFPLVVRRRGPGTVQPNLDGEFLRSGRRYSMTARPAAGSVFAGWTGGATSSAPTLSFVMQANLELEAVFIPDPFIGMQGMYSGLFRETNGFAPDRAGAFTLTATDRGTYSGKLWLGGKSYGFGGQLDFARTTTNTIPRKGTNAITIELLFAGPGTNLVSGRITDGNWNAVALGYRAGFHARTNPAPFAGTYTLVLPGQPDPLLGPEGSGFGTVKIDGSGKAVFAGTLADGGKVSQKASLSGAGAWPFHVPLSGGAGALSGWLSFTNTTDGDLSGQLDWARSGGSRVKIHPAGFTNTVQAVGSRFRKPAAGERVLDLSVAEIRFSGGNLAAPFTNTVQWDAKNKITSLGGNKLSLSVSISSGLFSGSVTDPATGKSSSFKGAVLQKQNAGAGFLPGTNRSARVLIGASSGGN